MSRMQDGNMDGSLPIRDMGSFVRAAAPSDADIQEHRNQDKVYIGLHLPRTRPQRHRRRHRHHRSSDRDKLAKEEFQSGKESSDGIQHLTSNESTSRIATPPSQRVQFILGEEEDDDHRAHDLFCEMTELFTDGEKMEWKETARWIKFEEDVEEGGERWSKPHVATLSLHSLFELRCSLLSGTVMLDMDAYSLDQVINMVLDNMVASKQLEDNLRDQLHEVITLRHRHQNEKKYRDRDKMHLPIIRSLADIGKKYSEPKGLGGQGADEHSLTLAVEDRLGAKSSPNFQSIARNNSGIHVPENGGLNTSASFTGGSVLGDIPENASHKVSHDPLMKNLHFMKKIPPGAEASNIMVGEMDCLNHQIVAFVRLSRAVLLGDLTEVPVPSRFLFLLLGPTGNQNRFHEIGRSIATLMSDEIFHDVAYHARNREDLLAGIDEFLDQVTVLPPGEWDPSIRIEPPKSVPSQEGRKQANATRPLPNGKAVVEDEGEEERDLTLTRTGRFFGGLIDDVKRKVKWWPSDFKDAIHVQCLASFIFLYFACLTPIITFGGLLGDATGNNMAALESILAGAICGITYSLCAGQPLTILGSTGPVLVFETILNHFCSDNGIDYLQFRLWIGIWTGLILIFMVAFDLSALVRFITRFTEESFAALISLIFIYEALAKLIKIKDTDPYNPHPGQNLTYDCWCGPSNSTNETVSVNWTDVNKEDCEKDYNGTLSGPGCNTPVYVGDVFFFSIILFFGTFVVSFALKMMKDKPVFPTVVRSVLSDFSVLIAIILMVGLDILVGLHTPKLEVPSTFSPTNPDREWFIMPFGKNPWWFSIAALIPALLCTILIFMDQQITAVIVNRKENKLKKGHGYHLDLFIVAFLIIVNSFLGLPWFVAATVLSINHVNSLKKESQCAAPGEKPKFLGIRENRLTGVMIFLMIGLSVLLTSVLMFIPMPVLFGVFLYMGVSSLKGMELVDRVAILFMPTKYQPDLMYLRHVRTKRVHIFTAIQLFCLIVLWVIKTIKVISIAFPIMVLAMCFVRKGMDFYFSQNELKWLDDIMPEAHKREKEDKKKDEVLRMMHAGDVNDLEHIKALWLNSDVNSNLERRSLIEGNGIQLPLSDSGVPVEHITISAELDSVNITEEVAKTAMWRTIVANDSSSNLTQDEARQSNSKKKKKHSKKTREKENGENLPTIPGSPHAVDEEHRESPRKKAPVKFYIDEDLTEEKESLIKPPEIVVDPPSEVNLSSPEEESKM
ncbi:sodium bicarbonate cotransporter 3 isoform X3 [Patella vulgata]|uniref:sodium bicarbonate cotransporter 3 isoform X3 n=1 Tax=Patella vulgata TaxID=6465 RepID=UPI00217F469D|nr:sodium bicarbonate cotransporter 3 isoform X3 [Patella vulgata]